MVFPFSLIKISTTKLFFFNISYIIYSILKLYFNFIKVLITNKINIKDVPVPSIKKL